VIVWGIISHDGFVTEMADLFNMPGPMLQLVVSKHPHLRRVTVETPNGLVAYPAPAPVFDGETRAYGPVPALSKVEIVSEASGCE